MIEKILSPNFGSFRALVFDFKFMVHRALYSTGMNFWTTIFLVLFGLVFLVVGISRVTEFAAFKFSRKKNRILIASHIFGCIVLTFAFILLALDANRTHNFLLAVLLFFSLGILLPIQIYLGLLRRIELRDAQKR